MKRTPLRRHRPSPVPFEERVAVYERDNHCFLLRVDRYHECRDQWGTPHAPDDWAKLTVDHVKPAIGWQKRVHDRRWMVPMCHSANVGVPSKEVRAAERAYLAEVAA
jgi:hypothetical protein